MRKQLLTSAAIILATVSVGVRAKHAEQDQDRNQQPAAQQPAQQNQGSGIGAKPALAEPDRVRPQPSSAQSNQPSGSGSVRAVQPAVAAEPVGAAAVGWSNTAGREPAVVGAVRPGQPAVLGAVEPAEPVQSACFGAIEPGEQSAGERADQPAANNQPSTGAIARARPAVTTSPRRRRTAVRTTSRTARRSRTDNKQQNTAQDNRAGANAQVSVNREQQTRISTVISRTNVRPLTNVNFSISVGTAIPATVVLTPLPADIVTIVPQYRGYSFFVVRDEIVIVEPSTKKIVTVISRSGDTAAAPAGSSTTTRTVTKSKYTDKQRDAIRKSMRTRTTTGASSSTEIQIGDRVPDTIELQSFDTQVIRTVPTVKTYRYITSPRGVYVVDPQRRVVIEEID